MTWAEEVDRREGMIPLGATRPPLVPWIGLPFSACLLLGLVCVELAMFWGGLSGTISAAGLFVAIWAPLRWWVERDWYALAVIGVWFRTSSAAFDAPRWGGATITHFPLSPRHRRQEVRGLWHV
jgi:type IV secretory pathway VirB3-like protein